MAGLRLISDIHVSAAIVSGLRSRGFDVVRVVDVLAEDTPDAAILDYAAHEERVLLSFDRAAEGFVMARIERRLAVPGMITCAQSVAQSLSPGQVIHQIEALARIPDAFAYPIVYLKDHPLP